MRLITLASPEELLGAVDLLCIPASKEMLDLLHIEVLSALIPAETLPPVSEILANKKNSTLLFYGQYKGRRVKVLLMIECEKLNEAIVYTICKKLSIRSKIENANATGLLVHQLATPDVVQSAFTGWTAGQYEIGLYKNGDDDNGDDENGRRNAGSIHSYIPHGFTQYAENGITIGMVQHEVMTLVNVPASHKSPAALGRWAENSGAEYNYKVNVLTKDQLLHLGMHALLAVNRGSEDDAHCIVTHYEHPEAS
ncbi:MAG: hypothetical protein M3R25_02125, partial [Bacteroidota bacterium]|nr:hypothetical protein [Bacteroidota bacterium]